jgi:hypothetical protein
LSVCDCRTIFTESILDTDDSLCLCGIGKDGSNAALLADNAVCYGLASEHPLCQVEGACTADAPEWPALLLPVSLSGPPGTYTHTYACMGVNVVAVVEDLGFGCALPLVLVMVLALPLPFHF